MNNQASTIFNTVKLTFPNEILLKQKEELQQMSPQLPDNWNSLAFFLVGGEW